MTVHFDYNSTPTRIFGLSTDTKPINQDTGDLFYETDTFTWYVYAGSKSGGWVLYYPM